MSNTENASAAVAAKTDLPATWPGAFGVYQYSRDAIRRNIWLLVTLIIINFVISAILGLLRLGFAGTLLSIVAGTYFGVVITRIMIAGVRGHSEDRDVAFTSDLPLISLKMIGLNLLVALTGLVSLLLFIIPFFIVMPRLTLASYFLIDKNMGVVEAFKASWNATSGNASKVWGIIGASFVLFLPILTIIGIPFAIYFLVMYSAAYAVLYEFLLHHPAPVPAPAAVAAQ